MSISPLLECVPNFSEGRDGAIIDQIVGAMAAAEGVEVLDVDPGRDTNRTVVTIAGSPEAVVEAAFQGIRRAAELIDMRRHKGAHPRMGATDVCPLIPISGLSLEEAAEWARRLAQRVGEALNIPVYLYEAAATRPERRNLADIRTGEYEALPDKLARPEWAPDFGPATFHARAGATAIGARDFLLAFNVNLNTTSVRRANSVAFDVREKGRLKREGNPITGPIARDKQGQPLRVPGACKGVKAIGWYIDDYGLAQVSMNITDIKATPLHEAFEACRRSAAERGLRVSGSELVGMAPLACLLDAGRYYLRRQRRSLGVPEAELIKIAVKSMGLDELRPFDPQRKIIEYRLRAGREEAPLAGLSLRAFTESIAAESVTPGGGSVAAAVGALAAALAAMVANGSANKRGWDERWEFFSNYAEQGQALRTELLRLVDTDAKAFNAFVEANRLPKTTPEERENRARALVEANRLAIETPLRVMELCDRCFPLLRDMVEQGNPNAVSDAAAGALCARAAAYAAQLNVLINLGDCPDEEQRGRWRQRAQAQAESAERQEQDILERARRKMDLS
jgi:glutamate formiminotransferase/formiminotetrahydrofolate cyclodeaminase